MAGLLGHYICSSRVAQACCSIQYLWQRWLQCKFNHPHLFTLRSSWARRAPSAGGQYHWISEFAPPGAQKLLSYIIGWLTVLGWQVGLASVCYAVSLQIESLVILFHPDFTLQGWQVSLITIAVALCAVLFNTVLVEALPTLEFVLLVLRTSYDVLFLCFS